MKRKVVKHGPSSLIVSMPSNWAKRNNITKGSEVDVTEEGKRLIISAENPLDTQHMEIDVDVTGLDRTSLMFMIRTLYRLGYDGLNVKFENTLVPYYKSGEKLSVISVLYEEVNRLIGYEIIQEKGNFCIIRDLEAATMKDFDKVERRIFLLMMDAATQLVEGAKNQDAVMLKMIEERHNTITKFVSYCLRLLNKGRYVSMDVAYHYHIIATLDRLTDMIKYAARDVLAYSKKLQKETLALLEVVNRHLRLYYELFYNFNKEKVVELSQSRYRVKEMERKLPASVKIMERRIASNIENVTELILDLVEARTGLEYAPQSKIS